LTGDTVVNTSNVKCRELLKKKIARKYSEKLRYKTNLYLRSLDPIQPIENFFWPKKNIQKNVKGEAEQSEVKHLYSALS
jgi:hypothetical protein